MATEGVAPVGRGGWPLVASTTWPGELALACPRCGSQKVLCTGHNLGSDVVRGNLWEANECLACYHREVWRSSKADVSAYAAPDLPVLLAKSALRQASDAACRRGWDAWVSRFGHEEAARAWRTACHELDEPW